MRKKMSKTFFQDVKRFFVFFLEKVCTKSPAADTGFNTESKDQRKDLMQCTMNEL